MDFRWIIKTHLKPFIFNHHQRHDMSFPSLNHQKVIKSLAQVHTPTKTRQMNFIPILIQDHDMILMYSSLSDLNLTETFIVWPES